MDEKKQSLKTAISLLFVISGIAGLIYQIVWFKYLSLFLGNTTYAQMTVLAAFLGGLAFGNYLFGKKADTLNNPVLIYSLLELFIGFYCLLYPAISRFAGNFFLTTAAGLDLYSQGFLFNCLRFLTAFILLFAPTTAMGGTLPVLSKFFVDKLQDARKEIAILYFLNSFGAVVGIVLSGFVLIKSFGLNITIYATACLNIAAGLTGFILSRKAKHITIILPAVDGASPPARLPEITKRQAAIVILSAGLSGAAALLYEMVWVRLLINFFGSSTYAFSIMLMAFIGGITTGSLIVSQNFIKKFNLFKLLAFTQSAIAVSTMLVLIFYERLPYFLWKIAALFSKSSQSFEIFLAVEFLICFILLFLPTTFMGMSLPIASEIVSGSNNKVGFSVGRVFSVNTLGTVAGVIFTGLIFIPLLGIKGAFEIGIALNLFTAVLLALNIKQYSLFKKISFVVISVFVFTGYVFLHPSWNEKIILSGVFRSFDSVPPNSFEEFTKLFDDDKIVFYKEGQNATVAVVQSISNPANKRLIINGKPDASTFFDMPTQVLLGQIPMMLHPNPKNIFVVGFGSGTTIGSVLTHPVDKVTCAEISKEVINAADLFVKENRNCIKDPRLKIYNEDALTLLKLSKEKYDVIISEPSNPWIAGIGNLFSKEYFEKCAAKLDSTGIMVQWFHLYAVDDEVLKLVLNTFASVFKYSQLWSSAANDIILVGTKKQIVLDPDLFIKNFNVRAVNDDFKRIGILNPFTFLTGQTISPRGFFSITTDYPINSELHPLLEFLAPKSFYVGKPSNYLTPIDEKFDTLSTGLFVKAFSKLYKPSKEDLINTIEHNIYVTKNFRFAYGLSKFLSWLYPNDYKTNLLYSIALEKLGISIARKESLEKLTNLFPDSLQIMKDYNNIKILEKVNAATFLNIFPLDKEAGVFIRTTKPDSISQLSTFFQLEKVFLQNSQLDKAALMLNSAESLLRGSSNLIKGIKADDFCYTGVMINVGQKEYEKVFAYYVALLNNNPNYESLFRVRRLLAWDLMIVK